VPAASWSPWSSLRSFITALLFVKSSRRIRHFLAKAGSVQENKDYEGKVRNLRRMQHFIWRQPLIDGEISS